MLQVEAEKKKEKRKRTRAPHIWKGRTVDTSLCVRGCASVRLGFCPHQLCSTRATMQILYGNVLMPRYIFNHREWESFRIDNMVLNANRGDYWDFIWASLLSSIYSTLVASHAAGMLSSTWDERCFVYVHWFMHFIHVAWQMHQTGRDCGV